jgi:hypothetical protein
MKQTAGAGQWAGAEGVFAQRGGTVSRRPPPKNYSDSPAASWASHANAASRRKGGREAALELDSRARIEALT